MSRRNRAADANAHGHSPTGGNAAAPSSPSPTAAAPARSGTPSGSEAIASPFHQSGRRPGSLDVLEQFRRLLGLRTARIHDSSRGRGREPPHTGGVGGCDEVVLATAVGT